MSGKRDIVFSVELSAAASTGADNIVVTVQHTNADSGTYGDTTTDNYWATYDTFSSIAGNSTVPSIVHRNQTDPGSSNTAKPIGRYVRFKYVVTNSSGSASFTGKIRMSYNRAVVD